MTGASRQTAALTVHIKTYGCQMNERDSEALGVLLGQHGYRLAADEDAADVLIVNTCSVRGKAEDKASGKLGLMVAAKREHPGRIVGAVGCMVQRVGEEMLRRVRGLDFAVGTHRLSALPAVIDAVRAGRGPVVEAGERPDESNVLTGHEAGQVSAFVNILLGCDRHCAYCIVPAVRGREWNRPADGILRELSALAEAGMKEVTLLGQSVMSYGRANAVWPAGHVSPRGFQEPLPRLLEAASAIPGLARIRFTSGHPSGCTAELARAMAELAPVCDHLHMPAQSGSDRILKAMRRGYSAEDYLEAVRRLRAAVPTLALTTDVIVGFPGETGEDFEATRRLMEAARFDNAFIFKYSPREGTPAAALTDDVPAAEKLRRNHVLLKDQDRRGLEINMGLVGRKVTVLAEGPSLRNAARWAGRTTTNKIVVFEPRPATKAGGIVAARIEKAGPQTLYGAVVGENEP
jgi:tRNA-2-methylthio-N6-dimethylallyladenosine synthase